VHASPKWASPSPVLVEDAGIRAAGRLAAAAVAIQPEWLGVSAWGVEGQTPPAIEPPAIETTTTPADSGTSGCRSYTSARVSRRG
jgi:hypothetical protein